MGGFLHSFHFSHVLRFYEGDAMSKARVLVLGPQEHPWGVSGYGGVERVCGLVAVEMARRGHMVIAVTPSGSKLWGVAQVPVKVRSDVDIVLDFTHKHLERAGWFDIPNLSWFWHDPALMRVEPAPQNMVGLSQWAVDRWEVRMGRKARVLDCICADETIYRYDPHTPIEDYYIILGIVSPPKGALEAARVCVEAGVKAKVIGPIHHQEYGEALLAFCKAHPQVEYLGELKGEGPGGDKLPILRKARGLIYTPQYPPGTGEVHSMKMAEALMLGVPCLATKRGAIPEVFDGIAALGDDDKALVAAIRGGILDKADRKALSKAAGQRWGVRPIVDGILAVMKEVRKGATW